MIQVKFQRWLEQHRPQEDRGDIEFLPVEGEGVSPAGSSRGVRLLAQAENGGWTQRTYMEGGRQ